MVIKEHIFGKIRRKSFGPILENIQETTDYFAGTFSKFKAEIKSKWQAGEKIIQVFIYIFLMIDRFYYKNRNNHN